MVLVDVKMPPLRYWHALHHAPSDSLQIAKKVGAAITEEDSHCLLLVATATERLGHKTGLVL
jgi:hypothetical protein